MAIGHGTEQQRGDKRRHARGRERPRPDVREPVRSEHRTQWHPPHAQRRALDALTMPALTEEERESLRWLVAHWGGYLGPMVMNDPAYVAKRDALSTLSRLIGGAK